MSLPPSFKNEINALEREISKAQPKDVLQYCADFFSRRLASQRTEFLLGGHKSNGGMTDTMSNPFGNKTPFGSSNKNVNSINEDDEERDSFGSPADNAAKDTGRSPFSNASPFGAAAGGAAAGAAGGFGAAWAMGSGNDQDQQAPANYAAGGRRVSVSAESMQPSDSSDGSWKPPKHPKTDDQLARLKTAVAGNFLFSHLDDDSFGIVLDALVEKSVPAPNIKVITQGDEGDNFYVIESGDFDIHIHPSGSVQSGADGMGNKVASIGPGGSFGELALMYNAPRAATVVSSSKGMLWALDRVTFRRILMDSAYEKRRMYEGFLEEVPLLKDLKTYERAKIADALESVKYPAGTVIIKEGDAGDNFYLLESGEAQAFKRGTEQSLKDYERGDYFGELALLDDKPRAASVVARTEVKVAQLGRDGFKRLLGPVESIMRREEYDEGGGMDPLVEAADCHMRLRAV